MCFIRLVIVVFFPLNEYSCRMNGESKKKDNINIISIEILVCTLYLSFLTITFWLWERKKMNRKEAPVAKLWNMKSFLWPFWRDKYALHWAMNSGYWYKSICHRGNNTFAIIDRSTYFDTADTISLTIFMHALRTQTINIFRIAWE